MKTLNPIEFARWCDGHGIEVGERKGLRFRVEAKLTFLLPKGRRIKRWPQRGYASRSLRTSNFLGPSFISERGVYRDLLEAPAQVFSEAEFPDARAFWTLPIILGWDAFLIPENPDYFVFNSHDEVVSFVCRTKERYEQLLAEFKDWDPEKGDWYFH